MGKPVNIASTSHAQQAELAALLGGPRGAISAPTDEYVAELERANQEGAATVNGLNTALDKAQGEVVALTAELTAEREAHAKTQAALAAATSAPTGE